MTNIQRLEFVTRHFRDLQTIRFAPLPTAMILALAAHWIPHVSVIIARGLLVGFLLLTAGFYWWTTVAIRRRYGSVKPSRGDRQQIERPPIIAGLQTIFLAALILFGIFGRRTHFSDLYIPGVILIGMLTIILDPTNPAGRRIAWAIGLVVLFTAGPFLAEVAGGAVIFALAGAVWLSISIFDFLLLRRTFAGIAASPPTAAPEAVLRHG